VTGRGTSWQIVALIFLVALVTNGCVTVGEYERLKEKLSNAENRDAEKRRQIEELEAEKQLYQEKALSLEDETGRYRQHSVEADRIIGELNQQISELQDRAESSVIEGVEIFKLSGNQGSGTGIRLRDDILFDSGAMTLKSQGETALNWVANELKSRTGQIEIMGHTDSDPVVKTKDLYPFGNIQLSVMRAIAVMDFLRKSGVTEDRMSVKGYGPFKPLAPNDNPDNKMKNRRVEIILYQ